VSLLSLDTQQVARLRELVSTYPVGNHQTTPAVPNTSRRTEILYVGSNVSANLWQARVCRCNGTEVTFVGDTVFAFSPDETLSKGIYVAGVQCGDSDSGTTFLVETTSSSSSGGGSGGSGILTPCYQPCFIGCSVGFANDDGQQSIPTFTGTGQTTIDLDWGDLGYYDSGGFNQWRTSTPNVINIPVAGWYSITGQVAFTQPSGASNNASIFFYIVQAVGFEGASALCYYTNGYATPAGRLLTFPLTFQPVYFAVGNQVSVVMEHYCGVTCAISTADIGYISLTWLNDQPQDLLIPE
jgi:hypothetical protein